MQQGTAGAVASVDVEPGIWLTRLSLTAFRSYEQAVLEVDARPVVLTGPNGAGKTNLLEAISFLCPGRGLRAARLPEVDRRPSAGTAEAGERPWAVAAEVMTPEGSRSLGTGRDATARRDKRLVKLDGGFVASQQALADVLSVVWLTPQMDRLFQEGPSERRRFLDRLAFGVDPAHAGRIAAYDKALRERSRLLRGEAGPRDPAWLNALEETMARHGIAIAAARCDITARLASACAASGGRFPQARLSLSGDLEAELGERPALAVEEQFRDRLSALRGEDAETGGAALGPHRSDLVVHHGGRDMPAALCSTGEQKALLIAIVLAHARLLKVERGAAPIMLLDEVTAHLDETRREALFEEILRLRAQAWLTGTDRALFEPLGRSALQVGVADSQLTPAAPTRIRGAHGWQGMDHEQDPTP